MLASYIDARDHHRIASRYGPAQPSWLRIPGYVPPETPPEFRLPLALTPRTDLSELTMDNPRNRNIGLQKYHRGVLLTEITLNLTFLSHFTLNPSFGKFRFVFSIFTAAPVGTSIYNSHLDLPGLT